MSTWSNIEGAAKRFADAADAEIESLRTELLSARMAWETSEQENSALEAQISTLQARIKELESQLGRDHLLQPYDSKTSVWNTPIGDAAVEKPAGLPANYNNAGKITTDEIYICMDPNAPIRPITNGVMLNQKDVGPPPENNRLPAGARCHVDSDDINDSRWNGISGFLDADNHRYAWTGQPLNRPTVADDPQIYRTGDGYPTGIRGKDDLFGDGRRGSHGGGQAGGIGGTIRAWEYDAALADGYNINHRLALNVHGATVLSQANRNLGAGLSGPGWRFPAFRADSGFSTSGTNNFYGRTGQGYDGVVMGSLLALPKGYDLSGITDPLVKSIGWALLNFGCHIVDVTGFTKRYAVSVEANREAAWLGRPVETFHQPLMKLITSLVLIDDCLPTKLGGAGNPRVPYPAPLVQLAEQ